MPSCCEFSCVPAFDLVLAFYNFQIVRLQLDIIEIAAVPLPATPGWTDLPAVVFAPTYRRDVLIPYTSELFCSVAAIQLNITFLTVGSLYAVGPDGTIYPLVSGVLSSPIALLSGVNSSITLVSAQDGNYSLSVFRDTPDTDNITLIAYNVAATPTPLPISNLIPSFTPGTYTYTLIVPYGTEYFSVNGVSLSGSGVITTTGSGDLFPLLFQGWNDVFLNNTKDG
jgi:hypothetical protein